MKIAVCIPTRNRPDVLQRVLESLIEQSEPADVVLVVDSSTDDSSLHVCREFADRFEPATLLYERSAPGLTGQRRVGIAKLASDPEVRYIAFLDDDIVLEPEYLSVIVSFMESEEGEEFGGVCGYDMVDGGRPFGLAERFFHRLGVIDGDLRPGRWAYCGYFLELDKLSATDGIVRTDFLPGSQAVWRTEVFERFLPPIELPGYALNEDKHFSLRAGTAYALAAHCGARAWHRRAPSGRPRPVRFAFDGVRNFALMLRDCDPEPTLRRYAAFLGFQLLWNFAFLAGAFARWGLRDFQFALGLFVGWGSCIVRPPARTRDAIAMSKRQA